MIHVTLLVSMACGFYLPGVAPREFQVGEEVKIKVNKLDSTKTQIPFDYYDMPFCRPTEIKLDAENLGEVLMGDRIENSAYEVHMRNDKVCSMMASAGITALLKKMDYKDVVIAIDGSLFRFHPHFKNVMQSRISQLMGINYKFDLLLSEDGSGRGAALVAAVLKR